MRDSCRRARRAEFIAVATALLSLLLVVGCAGAASSAPTPAKPAASPPAVAMPTGTVAASPTAVAARPTSAPTPVVATVTPAELKALLEGPDRPPVFDTRDRASYDYEHLPGAVSLPSGELAARLSEIPKDRLAVFYCTGAT